MDVPGYPLNTGGPHRPTVDAGRLWAGGLATAVVAALVAAVAALVARGLLDIPVFAPAEEGALGGGGTLRLALWSATAALVATAVLHGLLLSTPSPFRFFSWIVGLATVVAMLLPFLGDAPLSHKLVSAATYLVIGLAIGSLVSGAARSATRLRRAP